MPTYEVVVDWNACSRIQVEAGSPEEAEEMVQDVIDSGLVPGPEALYPQLFDPEVAFGLAELVE